MLNKICINKCLVELKKKIFIENVNNNMQLHPDSEYFVYISHVT